MISKSPITDKRIAELGSNMVSDLCKEFEAKYHKARLELLFTRKHLEKVEQQQAQALREKEEEVILRVVKTMKAKGIVSENAIYTSPTLAKYWEDKHKGNIDPMEAT